VGPLKEVVQVRHAAADIELLAAFLQGHLMVRDGWVSVKCQASALRHG
jgi:hypothetical protein